MTDYAFQYQPQSVVQTVDFFYSGNQFTLRLINSWPETFSLIQIQDASGLQIGTIAYTEGVKLNPLAGGIFPTISFFSLNYQKYLRVYDV